MKVKCHQKDLALALNLVNRAVSTNTTLPVLNNILIKAQGKKIYFSATNLEVAITYFIEADILNEGAITVPAKLITNYISLIKEDEINLKLDVIKFYTHYLEEIVLYGLSHRVKIFCILQPRINNGFKKNHPKEAVFYSIKDKQDKYDMHYVFSVFSSLFNDMEKKYSNNDTVLIKDYSAIFKNVSDEIYVDEIHYNDFGNLIIAQKIASDVQSYLKNEITRAQIIN